MTAAAVENEKTRQRGGLSKEECRTVKHVSDWKRAPCCVRSPLCSLCISIQRVTFFAGQRAARYSAFSARLLSTQAARLARCPFCFPQSKELETPAQVVCFISAGVFVFACWRREETVNRYIWIPLLFHPVLQSCETLQRSAGEEMGVRSCLEKNILVTPY